jgi:hypothetical protein
MHAAFHLNNRSFQIQIVSFSESQPSINALIRSLLSSLTFTCLSSWSSVYQGLLQIALKKPRNGTSVFDQNLVTRDEILKYIFNPVFSALSTDHQGNLKERIKEVIRWIMADEKMKEAFGSIEQQGGYKLKRPLDKLQKSLINS